MALTTRPARADGVNPSGVRSYAYAPVAITAVAVAYWIDGPDGQPYTGVRLDQRLVVKLAHAVLQLRGCCGAGVKPAGYRR